MNVSVRAFVVVLPSILLPASPAVLHAADAHVTFAQVAQHHPRSASAPKAADVCFSSRWPNPGNRDSIKTARAFHATRFDWLYMSGKPAVDKAFVGRLKAAGYLVGGTLNCQPVDSPTAATRSFSIGRTVDMQGEPLKDPWTRKYGGRFCCPNNPEYATIYLAHARYALDAGVDHFQMDGVQLNDIMTKYGGCFCPHCIKGFRDYLAAHSTPDQRARWGVGDLAAFDYAAFLLAAGTKPDDSIHVWKGPKELRDLFREFQVESGIRFLSDMHKRIEQMAGRAVAHSCNANEEFLTTYHRLFDFALNEAYSHKEGIPAFLYEQRLKKAQALGKSMLFTFVSNDVQHNRRFIASAYALGANVIVPWDVFTGLDTPRFYGTPEQFADLFGFVRANAEFLEGYEEAAVLGAAIHDSRYDADRPPVQVYASSPVLAVVRAKPGQTDAAVVVHLAAATGDNTGPLRVTLDPTRFFAGRPLKMRFLTPAPYVAAAHEKAEVSHDFAPLCRTNTLPAGRLAVVELPAVDPWGILVVEPDNAHERAVWQPGIWCDEGSRCDEKLVVRLDCATRGGDIRYTLDGTQPTESSALYRQPLRLGASVELKARTFGPSGANGPVASARFHRNEARPRSAPDAPALRDSLRLWLKAETLAATLQDGDQVKKWPAVVGPGAALPAARLLSGATADAPTFGKAIFNGRPAVHFDGVDDQMVIPQFANAFLAGKPLTVVLVTRSSDNSFGVCGNAANGSGGVPRLYMTRAAFNYDKHGESVSVNAPLDLPAITVYRHDGRKTASARCNGRPTGSRDDLPAVKAFGGGNLAFPLWVGTSHSGELAEILAYDRALADSDIEALEEDLAQRYGIAIVPRWR